MTRFRIPGVLAGLAAMALALVDGAVAAQAQAQATSPIRPNEVTCVPISPTRRSARARAESRDHAATRARACSAASST
jgi:hypothetical protein